MKKIDNDSIIIKSNENISDIGGMINCGLRNIYIEGDYSKYLLQISIYNDSKYFILKNITDATKRGKVVNNFRVNLNVNTKDIYKGISDILLLKSRKFSDLYSKLLDLEKHYSNYSAKLTVENSYNVFSPFVKTDLTLSIEGIRNLKNGVSRKQKLAKLLANHLEGEAKLIHLTSDDATYDVDKAFNNESKCSIYFLASDLYCNKLSIVGLKDLGEYMLISLGNFNMTYEIKYKKDNTKRYYYKLTKEDVKEIARLYKKFVQKATRTSGRKIESLENLKGLYKIEKIRGRMKLIDGNNLNNIKTNEKANLIINYDMFNKLKSRGYSTLSELENVIVDLYRKSNTK